MTLYVIWIGIGIYHVSWMRLVSFFSRVFGTHAIQLLSKFWIFFFTKIPTRLDFHICEQSSRSVVRVQSMKARDDICGAIMAPQTPNIVACGKVLYSHARLKVSGRHNILGPKGSCRAKSATMRKAWQFLHAQNPKEDIYTEPRKGHRRVAKLVGHPNIYAVACSTLS